MCARPHDTVLPENDNRQQQQQQQQKRCRQRLFVPYVGLRDLALVIKTIFLVLIEKSHMNIVLGNLDLDEDIFCL